MSEMTQPDGSPAAAAAAALVSELPPEPQAQTVEQTETEAPQDDGTAWKADTTGIEDLLSDDEEPELAEETPEPTYDEADEYVEPDQAELRKLQKKLEWSEQQRVNMGRKNWKSEGKRRFPLAAKYVDKLELDSRKAYLKAASEFHSQVEEAVGPIMQKLGTTQKEAEAQAAVDARAQEVNAWGRPSTGPPVPVMENVEGNQQLDRRKHRTHLDMTRARMKHDPNFIDGI